MKLYLKLILKENAAFSFSQGTIQSKYCLSDLLNVQFLRNMIAQVPFNRDFIAGTGIRTCHLPLRVFIIFPSGICIFLIYNFAPIGSCHWLRAVSKTAQMVIGNINQSI